MGILSIIAFLLMFMVVMVLVCVTQKDCPDGFACFGGTCTECLTCSVLFRKGESCIVDFRECGECTDGYEEISLTDSTGEIIKPCKPVKKSVKFKECKSSSNCPPHNYCIEDFCVVCFNCVWVNRLPPVGGCARGLNECSSCLDGYSEVAITAQTNYTRCETERSVTHETAPPGNLFMATYTSIFCLIVGSTLLLSAFFLIRRRKGRPKNIGTNLRTPPSAPPLQEVETQRTLFKCITPQFVSTPPLVRFENEYRQEAKVFKMPDASYYTMGRDDEPTTMNASNSCVHPASSANAVSAQQQPVENFGLGDQDTVDSAVPEANEINGDSANGEPVAVDTENVVQVLEPPAEQPTEPATVRLSRTDSI